MADIPVTKIWDEGRSAVTDHEKNLIGRPLNEIKVPDYTLGIYRTKPWFLVSYIQGTLYSYF